MATVTEGNTAPEGAAPRPRAIASELRVVEWQNEWIVRSTFPFGYQAPDETLRELRRRYRLDEVIAPAASEWEQLLLLREWVHTRWRHGWDYTVPMRDALEILEAAECGREFACGYYALTLVQCLLALGFVARQVSVAKAGTEWLAEGEGNVGHAVMEVWSHQFHKWVLLDADLNVHYERDGLPLNALEIHRAWVGRRWDDVRLVPGASPFRMSDRPWQNWTREQSREEMAIFTRHRAGDYYAHLSFPMQNTRATDAAGPPPVEWIDAWTPPRLARYNQPNASPCTGNVHDLYWTVDQVQIDLRADTQAWASGEALLHVSLHSSTPNLARLLVRLDDRPWQETPPQLSWALRPGKNQIMARGVNAFGREGHTSRILLRYHP